MRLKQDAIRIKGGWEQKGGGWVCGNAIYKGEIVNVSLAVTRGVSICVTYLFVCGFLGWLRVILF